MSHAELNEILKYLSEPEEHNRSKDVSDVSEQQHGGQGSKGWW